MPSEAEIRDLGADQTVGAEEPAKLRPLRAGYLGLRFYASALMRTPAVTEYA